MNNTINTETEQWIPAPGVDKDEILIKWKNRDYLLKDDMDEGHLELRYFDLERYCFDYKTISYEHIDEIQWEFGVDFDYVKSVFVKAVTGIGLRSNKQKAIASEVTNRWF